MLTFRAASLGALKALLAGGLDQPEAEGPLLCTLTALLKSTKTVMQPRLEGIASYLRGSQGNC